MTKLLCARSWGKLLMILKIKCRSLHDSGRKGASSALVLHAVQFKKSPPAVCLTNFMDPGAKAVLGTLEPAQLPAAAFR